MKARFIAVKDKFEMHLENKQVIKSALGETKKMFLKRVNEETELDGDLEITQLTAEAFLATPADKLKVAAGKASGLMKVLLEEAFGIVSAKAGDAKTDEKAAEKEAAKLAKAEAAAKLKAEKDAAKLKAEKDAAKEAKALARAEAAANKPSLEEVMAAAAEAKANVGKNVKFSAHRTIVKTEGVVNGVWVDKRVPMALYRIFDADSQMFNKVISAQDLEFGEMAPNAKAEEKAAKAAEKEAAKAEAAAKKLAAAEAKNIAKAEAAKAKEEAATLKAAEKAEALAAKAEKAAADLAAKKAAAEAADLAKQEAAAKLAEMKAAKIAEDAAKA